MRIHKRLIDLHSPSDAGAPRSGFPDPNEAVLEGNCHGFGLIHAEKSLHIGHRDVSKAFRSGGEADHLHLHRAALVSHLVSPCVQGLELKWPGTKMGLRMDLASSFRHAVRRNQCMYMPLKASVHKDFPGFSGGLSQGSDHRRPLSCVSGENERTLVFYKSVSSLFELGSISYNSAREGHKLTATGGYAKSSSPRNRSCSRS